VGCRHAGGRSRWSGAAARRLRLPALLSVALLSLLVAAAPARAAFGFSTLGSTFIDADGQPSPVLTAGSHPQAWVTTLVFNKTGPPGKEVTDGHLKDLRIELPPGLVGSTASLPKCARSDFLADECPASTIVGHFKIETPIVVLDAPLNLLEPKSGVAVQLGFSAEGFPLTIDLSLSGGPDHRLVAEIANASQATKVLGVTLTLLGDQDGSALLTMPRECGRPLSTDFGATAWAAPGLWVEAEAPEPQTVAGCDSLSYSPTIAITPTTAAAGAPSGLGLVLDASDPGFLSPTGRAAADTRSAVIDLPPGMTLNPAAAAGLAACTPAQLAGERPDADPATGCPGAAKIGSATLATPPFAGPVAGDVFVAQPDDPATSLPGAENPFDSLLALYLVFRDPERGILLDLPLRVEADPRTGRLTGALPDLPPFPLTHLALRFNSGPRAPLTTPTGCGSHAIGYSLTPSSGNPPLEGTERFETSSGCDGAFSPRLSAGTTSNRAGRAAPLVLELNSDAEAPNLRGLRLTLPPGLSADLGAVAICPEVDAASAACPPASRLGYARIAIGAGPEPLWVPADAEPDPDVFLAGPYRGSPFSLLVSIPAEGGPFDLGQEVLRAPVGIDPETAQVSVELDDLPQVRAGIPLRYRAIRLVLDRPGFIRNPTSCAPERFSVTATAAGGATATAGEHFQAADCGRLRFRPRLAVRLSGRTGRNGHPRVEARMLPRAGQANLDAVSIDLPAGELLDVRRIRGLCRSGLPLGRCPASSRIGRVSLRSPLLRQRLRGPIYLRAPSGRYPDLVAELEGGGVRFVLHGRTATAPGGRLRIRLEALPDIPLSEASLTLAGGRRGIVVNSTSLCRRAHRAGVLLRGHNGRELRMRPLITPTSGC
jgi:hypothetical protein